MELLNKIMINSSDGYISINNDGYINLYNQKAKEIFGIVNKNSLGHSDGKLESGDFVIIADNSLGFDDGNLMQKNLENFNINENIDYGEGFILAGIHGEDSRSKLVKGNGILNLKTVFNGIKIEVIINPVKREIIIKIGEYEFSIKYFYSFGHILILDAKGRIKFYQEQGYTARGESILEILNGKKFLAKYPNKSLEVQGKKISEIHKSEIIEKFCAIARKEKEDLLKQPIEINGKPIICDIYQTDSGACMRIEDISEYESLILSKEKIFKKLKMNTTPSKEEMDYEVIDFSGNSSGVVEVRRLAYKAAKSLSTVVLLGESGTGKSLLAREIHENSISFNEAFIEVNCSAIPENLFESEFFGYERGAFTGASQQGRKGFFELANHGTLFLDEIAEIPFNMQSKLLHVLQNKRFYRVGSSKETIVDFRLIIASNRDLYQAVKNGEFREDLYYRLNVFPINIPPLRDRNEDIPLLIEKILPRIRKKTLKNNLKISSEAIIKLTSYKWTGNVRELENVLERVSNIIDYDEILPSDLNFLNASDINTLDLKMWTSNLEKNLMLQAIKLSGNDYKKAMELLNIKKSAFYDKLNKYNLE